MTEPLLSVTVDLAQQPRVVTVIGEIDRANVEQFTSDVARATADAPRVTLDISGVSYCDSAAVRALFGIASTVEVTLVISPTGPIKTLLRVSGLDQVVTVNVSD
ncbi:STAS domain-containing protein [Mycobacterium sp. ML4]